MVTNISVTKTGDYFPENRPWLIGEHGADLPINVTFDFTAFTGANFSAGYIKSGTILARLTSGKVGPYVVAGSGGSETAIGVLFNTVQIPTDTATVASDAALVHFHCKVSKLPYASGSGAIDAAGKVDLPLVYWN